MLEIREICKTYRAKSGVEVKALDHVTLTFPDHGMIFLLGKSGSGKSTLLNVVGGLDKFDEGELIIKGRSSRTFRRSDYDAYRNTFIGFIFQEYNILDDFSVGANIGLALELQGKKATSEEINRILTEVDLDGFGNRKPNELSGGQKQRIAIARALIKEPQIIMADEPTGALDSATGAQVLATLKKLSENKLVIVVSHDREFAETYGDRIIELADGCVISDTTITSDGESAVSETIVHDTGMQIVSDNEIAVSDGYTLTEDDLAAINAYLASHKNDVKITRRRKEKVVSAGKRIHRPTGEVTTQEYTKEDAKFIRSRLPVKKAAKMGLSSMRSKPVRLIFTILLSLVAFSMFGFADAAIAYKKTDAMNSTILAMESPTLSLALRLRRTQTGYMPNGEVAYTGYIYDMTDAFNDKDIADLKEKTGLTFYPVYNGSNGPSGSFPLGNYFVDAMKLTNNMNGTIFIDRAAGITEITREGTAMKKEDLSKLGFTLREDIEGSRLPSAPGEVAISYYHYKMFEVAGFTTDTGDNRKEMSILGKTLTWEVGTHDMSVKVVGVIDTGFDFGNDKWADLRWDAEGHGTFDSAAINTLNETLRSEIGRSFHTLMMAAPGTLDILPALMDENKDASGWGLSVEYPSYIKFGYFLNGSIFNRTDWSAAWVGNDELLGETEVIWYDDTVRTTLGDREYVISLPLFMDLYIQSMTIANRWDVSPIPTLREYLVTHEGRESMLSLTDHWWYTDREADGAIVREYRYGQAAGYTDNAEFEALLTTTFNEIYDIELTAADYVALANRGAQMFNNIQDTTLEHEITLAAFREVYRNYSDLYTSLMTDGAFFDYVKQENPASYATNMAQMLNGYSETEAKMFLTENAAKYIAGKRGKGAERVFGIDPNEIEKTAYLKVFRSLGKDGRTIGMQYINNGSEQAARMCEIVGVYISNDAMNYQEGVYSKYYYDLIRNEQFDGEGITDIEVIGQHESGKYGMVMCSKPADRTTVKKLVSMHEDEESDYVFRIQANELSTLNEVDFVLSIVDKVVLGLGIFFAIFASLMMFNFISVSITNKKREIGILRAVGARSRDVFLIFFAEAFVIALVNFALSASVSFLAVLGTNLLIRRELGIMILSFGIRQVALLLAVSLLVAFVSSFFPTMRIARKAPIDAMRDR